MSTDSPDPFADLLLPGEAVLATMAAAGAPRPNGARVWIQLASTQDRLLAVLMVQAPHGGPWQPVARHVGLKRHLHLFRYPRTPTSAARLEVDGLPEKLVLVDIDDPAVFPWLEPFLGAWGGPVEGAGVVHQRQVQAEVQPSSSPDPKLLMAIAGGMLALIALCCGCSGLFSLLGSWA